MERTVLIELSDVALEGALALPEHPVGLVAFAHGSGSSRHSPRNRAVADALQKRGFATLLFDLLTSAEEYRRQNRFDIDLLTRRLLDVTAWARQQPGVGGLRLGYFGASTGAAAAINAAAAPGARVGAIVLRGGRPDLAEAGLTKVRAPVLLIVGGKDGQVLDLNRRAYALLPAAKELAVVTGATHLFEEPGALEEVARLAGDWFASHLQQVRGTVSPRLMSAGALR